MRWFIYKDQKVYGPYEPERLAAFIDSGTMVTREGGRRWMRAGEDAELKPVLDGRIRPVPEWFANRRGHRILGPMTRADLVGRIESEEIGAGDLLRHESWSSEILLGRSRLYALWRDPSLDLDELSPEELTAAPRAHRRDMPSPPDEARHRMARAWRRLKPGLWWLLAALLLLLAAYGAQARALALHVTQAWAPALHEPPPA